MRFASVASALCLATGLCLSAPALAGDVNDRINAAFDVVDDLEPGALDASLDFNGPIFELDGFATGTGTGADTVEIRFAAPFPTQISVNDVKGRIRQARFGQLTLFIDSTEGRSLDLTLTPQKCDVDGSLNVVQGRGKVTVKCSSDGLWAAVSSDRVASIQAAFEESARVKIKVSGSNPDKGSISITIKGAIED